MELTGLVEARLLSVDDIVEVANRRSKLHVNHATRRELGADHDLVGLLGQWEFAKQFCLEVDLSDKPAGDGRINFITDIGTINVATYRKPYNLLREVGKECAAYHVLGRFKADGSYGTYSYGVKLLGWTSDKEMLQCPIRDFGYGVSSYYMQVRDLRPMIKLRHILLGEAIQMGLL